MRWQSTDEQPVYVLMSEKVTRWDTTAALGSFPFLTEAAQRKGSSSIYVKVWMKQS